ncbi:biotin carboxylase N-terminal domain-containing protein [Nocardioides sp. LHG3406-4]|uniref:acetyl/propionyl/methylcrotonyl-CoA carboxylase subunit alpha n=1 Tax=Nocardioides sp. LHG3406-4 TaxID=2804575 RepID=UPI003CF889C0
MITKILVANRGEIARRVFRTCREMGIATVAVYSDPDADAPFVLEADEAVPLGGSTPGETYLRGEAVLDAARLVGADAVHPGYGFLSENADFARQCHKHGITFIGPTPEAIEAMGSKLTAREIMQAAGVPVLPGVDLTDVPDDEVRAVADEVGWPVLVKASFGGGGRGMRVVRDPDGLLEAIASARREAGAAFGNDTVFLEHYVDEPRHVEIQIFGDQAGTIVHLNERECSIQRRHQKIIEESPSPVVDQPLRDRMGEAAVEAGRTLGYVGAGTVEFLLAPNGDFYFLEVNTRLQVEHPVTELVSGLDLVRLQIEVAAGAPLPPEAHAPQLHGHAVEARLYAEDPANDFLPAAGLIRRFEVPDVPGVRVDAGVVSGDRVSTNYDPMLAKVIAHGATRAEAISRLVRALRRARVDGITTNRSLLVGILEHEDFAAGRIDTHFLDRVEPRDLIEVEGADVEQAALLSTALADQADERASAKVLAHVTSGFRTARSQLNVRGYRRGDREVQVGYVLGRGARFEVDGVPVEAVVHSCTPDAVDLVVDGVRRRIGVVRYGEDRYVSWADGTIELRVVPRFPESADHLDPGSLVAPMPGTVVRVNVAAGDRVTAGETVVVVEAMKMEHAITASMDATVASVPVAPGAAVDTGTVLIVLTEDEEADDD